MVFIKGFAIPLPSRSRGFKPTGIKGDSSEPFIAAHKLRSTVMASTSIKMVGGLSAGDAGAFAREMQAETEFLQDMRKRQGQTEFACFVRNVTPRPIRLSVPFGQLEARPRISPEDQEALLRANRARYASGAEGWWWKSGQPLKAVSASRNSLVNCPLPDGSFHLGASVKSRRAGRDRPPACGPGPREFAQIHIK